MEINKEFDKGLSEFIQNTFIRRTGDIAEIIVDLYEDDPNKPVRLLGFATDANKSDFEIYEEGWHYYNELKFEISKSK